MFTIIERYIKRLTKEDVYDFAIKKNIILSDNELEFTFNFIKKNYKEILNNSNVFDINRYKDMYPKENFNKIVKVYYEYFTKYGSYL